MISSTTERPEEVLLRKEEHLAQLKELNEMGRKFAASLPAPQRRDFLAIVARGFETAESFLRVTIRAAASNLARETERRAFCLYYIEMVKTWEDVALRLEITNEAARQAGGRGMTAIATSLQIPKKAIQDFLTQERAAFANGLSSAG